jgi:hypothetical protein
METEGNKIRDLDAEGLASLARRYYAARFPNPHRLGCPPLGEIDKVVMSRQAPDEALREHLFECSECFGEYRHALAQCRPATDEAAWRKRLVLIFASKRSTTALAPVILILSSLSLIFISILILRNIAPEAGRIASSTPSDTRAGGTGESTANPADVAISTIPTPIGNGRAIAGSWRLLGISAPAAETIDVDLDNHQVFRRSQMERLTPASEEPSGRDGARSSIAPDEAQPVEEVITLPATRANLVLRLPETGVPGKYTVSLIDAFGQSLLSKSAFSPDGAKLQVTLDLSRVSQKRYRLRLWRNGEAPAFYDVIIGAR